MSLRRKAWLAALIASCLAVQGCNRLTKVRIDAYPDNSRVYVDDQYQGRGSVVLDGGYEYGFPRSYKVRIERQPYTPLEAEINSEPSYTFPVLWAAGYTLAALLMAIAADQSHTLTPAEKAILPLTTLAIAPWGFFFNHRYKDAYAFDLEARKVTGLAGMQPEQQPKSSPSGEAARKGSKKPFASFEQAYGAIQLHYPLPSGNRQLMEGALTELLTVASQSAALPGYLQRIDGKPLKVLEEVYHELDLDKRDARLEQALIRGLITSLNDNECHFLGLESYRYVTQARRLEAAGVGAEFGSLKGQAMVLSVREGTPAWQAGLKTGDLLLAVDGVPTQGKSFIETLARIQGFNGTKAKLRLQRLGKEAFDVELTRGHIKPVPLSTASLSPTTAYLRLPLLRSAAIEAECRKALESLKGRKGLVLDLRDNSQGSVETSLGVARMLVKQGPLVTVWTKELNTLSALGQNVLPESTRLVVLINEGTAAGAEVLAAALRRSGHAQLVGMSTFGIGTQQTLFTLGDGTGLRLTTEIYQTPDGDPISYGLTPDVEIRRLDARGKIETRRTDLQLQAALDLLQGMDPDEVEARYRRRSAY